MTIEKIITFANKATQLRFLAMERSLRSTGCQLPLWVIPYNDAKFELPQNCLWWELDEVTSLLKETSQHGAKRKFQCFLTDNYQYVDSDVIFLRNPESILKNMNGFVTSCCHWNNPKHTFVPSTLNLFKEKSTTWQKSVFNSGQFACDQILYDITTLREVILTPLYKEAFDSHDQISINLLVFLSGINVSNITLPPYNMESTWAGDYTDINFCNYWQNEERKPYLIHWAGYKIAIDKPIDDVFTRHLTPTEKEMLTGQLKVYEKSRNVSNPYRLYRNIRSMLARLGKG
jgi:hypothetical protein